MPNSKRGDRPAAPPRGPDPQTAREPASEGGARLTVAGIGASAGGLEAYSQLLESLPADPGAAIVLVQHLDPHRGSSLPEILRSVSKLPILEASQGVRLERDHVYVVPPNVQLAMVDGHLQLSPRPHDASQFLPIDFFFRSLAEHAGAHAIGVVLSGSASDGAAGLREVKAAGGITIAQEPESARHDGMPRSAIATGAVDLVLTPAEIGREIARIAGQAGLRLQGEPDEPQQELLQAALRRIFKTLRSRTGVDFSPYKLPTIRRRLHRRMVLHRVPDLGRYAELLERDPDEVDGLHQDLLIQVTRFFRDPEAFAVLAERVLPQITADNESIRMWVPGCSTGEEAYSLAMVLLETLGDRAGSTAVQIFATDLSERSIEVARAGVYPESIAADVSPERLNRFFTRLDGKYRIHRAVRDAIVFARQDLARDPPFSRLDLIVCRNVMIYLGTALQKKLLGTFHYALKPQGFLMLGPAESIGSSGDQFRALDKKHRLYVNKPQSGPFEVGAMPAWPRSRERAAARGAEGAGVDLGARAGRVLLERYAPPAVVVDADFRILQFRGRTEGFLTPAPGEASLSVLKMARDGLLHGLRAALHEARKGSLPATRTGLRVRTAAGESAVAIDVVPLAADGAPEHFLVAFRELAPPRPAEAARSEAPADAGEQVDRLEQELAASREYLQSIIQDLEATNEELKSANEEILSANEELQSTNEELDTSKEELQSTNEELNTLNEELQTRNEELNQLNGDLVNLLANVQMPIVMVSRDLRIRRFTPAAEKALNLIAADVGRPIGNIKPNVECGDLEELIRATIDEVRTSEREVRGRGGAWYSLRLRPYKSIDNKIDGAVLTLVDVDTAKKAHLEVTIARDLAEAIVEVLDHPLVVLDPSLKVQSANSAFRREAALGPAELRGRPLFELVAKRWQPGALEQRLGQVLLDERPIEGIVIEERPPSRRRWRVDGRRVQGLPGGEGLILLSMVPESQPDAGGGPR
jgi:two-component system CheB/CheR fusion protein